MSVDSDTIEHMFELPVVPLPRASGASSLKATTLGELRQRIRHLEHRRLPAATIPVLPGLDALFPEKGLTPGAVYSLPPHTSVMWALLAEATTNGHYVATVGRHHLGFHAAIEYGVALERLIVVPPIGRQWWSAVAALVDVVSIVVFSPTGPIPSPSARDTLGARARERGCALMTTSSWPGAHGQVVVEDAQWEGLGEGHGVLSSHELTLCYSPRHGASSHRVRLMRDGTGSHILPDTITPVVHLTPTTQGGLVTTSDQREAG
jgi:hypothetical protein